MSSPVVFKIKELNLDIIQPTIETMNDIDQGGSKTVVIGKPGCFAPGTKVLKYDGSAINVEDVKIGDMLMGDDSTPRKVLDLCHDSEMMYKIIPNKGQSVIVNENHILSLKSNGYNEYPKGKTIDIVLKDFLEKSKTFQKSFKWYRTGVEFTEKQIEINAYLLGYWLGDNSKNDDNINEILVYFEKKIEELELFFKENLQDNISNFINETYSKNNFLNYLRNTNLLENKYIPDNYKCNSRQIRLELLAGIIDSDGIYDNKSKGIDIVKKSEKLLDDIIFLVRSLGFSAYKKECSKFCINSDKNIEKYYKCFISGNIYEIPSYIIKKQVENKVNYKDVLVTSFEIKKLKKGEYYGFIIDNNHRFLLEDFSVVHNTGKTTLIASLLYAKKHIFPVGIAMSGSEDSNGFYRRIMPSTFVFNDYNEDKIKDFIRRQKIAREHLANPWGIILLDDCTDDPRIFNKPLQHGMYKRGRHWKMWYILSLQYAMDVKPVIRTNVDGIFILREPILKNRESLWRNYASIIPDFTMFCDIMDQLTDDYTALYINNASKSNNWQDCVFYYKAPLTPPDFKFGCDDYWKFHYSRYNSEYTELF